MGRFVKGDVVVLPYPFSDFSSLKRRPALVVAELSDDVILCQITSNKVADTYAIPIKRSDFATGRLRKNSNVRPNRLFTADSKTILYRAGKLKSSKVSEVTAKIIQIMSA